MIKLTIRESKLTEEAADRVIDAYTETVEGGDEPNIDWEALGIPKPNKEKREKEVKLGEEDWEEIDRDIYVDIADAVLIEELEFDDGTRISLKSGYTIDVIENHKDIYKEYLAVRDK